MNYQKERKRAVYLNAHEWDYIAVALAKAAGVSLPECSVTTVGRAELLRLAAIIKSKGTQP